MDVPSRVYPIPIIHHYYGFFKLYSHAVLNINLFSEGILEKVETILFIRNLSCNRNCVCKICQLYKYI